jgi:hypothetical protein
MNMGNVVLQICPILPSNELQGVSRKSSLGIALKPYTSGVVAGVSQEVYDDTH